MKRIGILSAAAFLLGCQFSSATAAVRTGYIAVGGTGSTSYISSSYALFGEYGLASDLAGAALVQFDDTAPLFSVSVLNNAASGGYSFIGLIRGYSNIGDDLVSGSRNYAYLAGTSYTAPGAIGTDNATAFTAATGAAEPYQSSVWSISGDTLSLSYLNSGGSTAGVTPMYFSPDQVLLATGDPAAFGAVFGGPSPVISLTFVASDVPEPATWVMMLAGFGAVGFALRRRSNRITGRHFA